MNATPRDNRAVALSQRVYQRLLLAYPKAHRREYGGAMAQLFRDQCRDAWNRRRRLGLIRLWLRVLPDLVKTALWERLTSREERKYMLRKLFGGHRSRSALLGGAMVVFVVVFILVVVSATIVTFILPEAYASRARIKVERDFNHVSAAAGPTQGGGIYDPYFIRTEIEVMQSEKILDQVIERLDLNAKWSAKYNSPARLRNSESRALLKRMIELRPARNTSLIDITVYSDDRQEAKIIANTIADVFRDYRREQAKQLQAAQTGSLDEYKKLKDELKAELAGQTGDPKAVDEKITATIARAGQVYQDSNPGGATLGVEIIEHAEAAARPVRPNKPLNIFIGMVAGTLLGLLAAAVVVILGTVMGKPPETARPSPSLIA